MAKPNRFPPPPLRAAFIFVNNFSLSFFLICAIQLLFPLFFCLLFCSVSRFFVFLFLIITPYGQWKFKGAADSFPGTPGPPTRAAFTPTITITRTSQTIAERQPWLSRKRLLHTVLVMFHAFSPWSLLDSPLLMPPSLTHYISGSCVLPAFPCRCRFFVLTTCRFWLLASPFPLSFKKGCKGQ